MAIFWPTLKPDVLVTGTLVEPAGIVMTGPSGSGCHSGVLTFPGLMIVSLGVGAMFVAVTTAANAGVPADKAGLAAALLNSSQQIGAALGLAILSAIATARTSHLLAAHTPPAQALTSGFHRALFTGAILVLATTVIAMRTSNSRGETQPALNDSQLERAEELV